MNNSGVFNLLLKFAWVGSDRSNRPVLLARKLFKTEIEIVESRAVQ